MKGFLIFTMCLGFLMIVSAMCVLANLLWEIDYRLGSAFLLYCSGSLIKSLSNFGLNNKRGRC